MTPFGRYELLRKVGAGGMADIWKARVKGPGGFHKTLAIKRILPELVEDHDFLRMFAEEAKLVASLSHPNIVQVLDFGYVGKQDYFIAMEYVAGVNLAGLLNRAVEEKLKLPPELALYVAMECARGLGHAHREGIIHRDVSPQNVLLSFSGEVKVTDFGIARVQSVRSRTVVGHVRGKVAYMSPEQAAADPTRPVDARSDLFSVGILLYEMLAAKRLFPGGSSTENHFRVIEWGGASREELANVPPVLRTIVSTCLQAKPGDRYQDAEDVERDLTSALGPEVFIAGRRFLSSLLTRLFAKELAAEREDDRDSVPPTNPQITMSEVDAPAANLGAIPDEDEEGTRGGTVISPEVSIAEPTVISPEAAEVSVGEATVLSPEAAPEPEPAAPLGPVEVEKKEGSGLTLAPRPTVAVRERTQGTGNFDEPLFPPQPPKKKPWLGIAAVTGGLLFGFPLMWLAIEIVSFILFGNGQPAVVATPAPRPAATVAATPVEIDEPAPTVALAPTPVRTQTPAPVVVATPPPEIHPVASRRPVRTPAPTATPEPGSIFEEPAPVIAMGTLKIDAKPACKVFIDRSKIAETTPFEKPIAAGKHTIGFVHDATGLWLEESYEVPAGATLELFVDVNEATVRVR